MKSYRTKTAEQWIGMTAKRRALEQVGPEEQCTRDQRPLRHSKEIERGSGSWPLSIFSSGGVDANQNFSLALTKLRN